jgi:hypothetical protein
MCKFDIILEIFKEPIMTKCLMLETPDKKRFFTAQNNYNKILEFANSFNCEISIVKLEEGEILDLVPLADAISSEEKKEEPKYELLEKKLYKPKKVKKINT